MNRLSRFLSAAVLSVSATAVAGAGLAFACTGPGFGTPQAPPTPAESTTPPPSGAGTSAPAQATPSAPATSVGVNTLSPGTTQPKVTSGAGEPGKTTGPQRSAPRVDSRGSNGRAGTGTAAAPAVTKTFAARERGATEGVARSAGQTVFASSAAPKSKREAAKGAKGARSGAASTSERSAVGDPWSGFSRATSSSEAGALSSSSAQGGSSLAMALLGLGLAGVLGTILVAVAAPRRRKAAARFSSRRRR